MLTRIELENFKSFKNRTTIDLNSTNYKILQERNVSDNGILKGAIFVGGNATGKTNIIEAIKLLLDLLFRERILNISIYKCLFSQENVIKLGYEFNEDGNYIKYLIEYNSKDKFMIEKLSLNGEILLDRIGKSGVSRITENPTHDDLDNDSLLLRTIYFNTKFNGYPILKKWFNYLINSIYIDASLRATLNKLNNHMDLREYLDKNGVDDINRFLQKYNFDQTIEYCSECVGNMTTIKTSDSKDIFFKREGIGEPIPYFMESLGNRNLINMLPSFFQVIANEGMLIIDEFSSAFHNELEQLLVRYFMKFSGNSQLFLVSHSTNLLSNSIFRPDQAFAVEFAGAEGSRINRFSNEKPREAQNIEKMYNSGCFGGKPDYNND